jgi:RNA polymerase sigma-70 factor (ECF subfamily)
MIARFEELIDRHHDEIFAYLWRLLGKSRRSDGSLEVEDLVQEVFLRAFKRFSSLRPDSNDRAWLYRIATNCVFSKLRHAKVRRDKMALLSNSTAGAHEAAAHAIANGDLHAAVQQLSPKQKACITLRYFNDLDYAEIATIVGCSSVSARANVSQGIRRLRRALEE